MTPTQALLVCHARLLGASWRRLTDLFAGQTQADGMALLEEAERVLGLPPGATEADEVVNGAERLADALGWLGDFDDDAQRVGCDDGGW